MSVSRTHTHTHTHTLTFRAANCYDFNFDVPVALVEIPIVVSPCMLHLCQKYLLLQSQKNRRDIVFWHRDSIPPPHPSLSLSLSKQRPASKSESNFCPWLKPQVGSLVSTRTGSFYEDAVVCSLSIAPCQTCTGRGHRHFQLWPVSRPAAAEEEGREGWGWLTGTIEGDCLDLSLFLHSLSSFFSVTLCPLSPSQYTHTHTHTLSFFFLVIIRAHTCTVTT